MAAPRLLELLVRNLGRFETDGEPFEVLRYFRGGEIATSRTEVNGHERLAVSPPDHHGDLATGRGGEDDVETPLVVLAFVCRRNRNLSRGVVPGGGQTVLFRVCAPRLGILMVHGRDLGRQVPFRLFRALRVVIENFADARKRIGISHGIPGRANARENFFKFDEVLEVDRGRLHFVLLRTLRSRPQTVETPLPQIVLYNNIINTYLVKFYPLNDF